MLKIIIVDDDKNVREFIKRIIDWPRDEFVICGEAANGKKGLQLALECQPDVIILDLEMPVMDGIEMLRRLAENNIKSKVVVLSCHNEFDYVKDAMKLGAYDYILKHKMKQEDFQKILLNIKDHIDEVTPLAVQKASDEKYGVHRQLTIDKNLNLYKSNALLELIKYQNISPQYTTEKQEVLALKGKSFFMISITVDYLEKINELKNRSLLIRRIDQFFFEYFNDLADFIFGKVEDGHFVVLFVLPVSGTRAFESKKSVRTALSLIQRNFQIRCGYTFSAGISNLCVECSEIMSFWEQAKVALSFKFYMGTNSISFFSDVIYCDNYTNIFAKMNLLKAAVNNRTDSGSLINDIFEEISNLHLEPGIFLKIFHNIYFIYINMTENLGINLDIDLDDKNYLYNVQKTSETLQDYQNKLIELLQMINNAYDTNMKKRYSKEIIKALEYIKSKYNSELTLKEVSDHISISRNYFSQLFKKETGVNFKEYIIQLRLAKAKEILKQTDMKVFSVAHAVGFQSHSYFNNIFKKYEGQTPKQYREQQCSNPDIQLSSVTNRD